MRGEGVDLTSTGEHCLNPTLLNSIQSALRSVLSSPTLSSALVTTTEGKFFSNGFDLSWAANYNDRKILLGTKLMQIVSDLFSLPMPTVAVVISHASTVVQEKIPVEGARREVVLRAGKVTTVRAAEMGIVDTAYDSVAETVEGGVRLGEELAGRDWEGELHARTRKASYPEACLVLGLVNFRPKL